MRQSAAERQRRFRQRRDADPVRRTEYLERQKQRYKILKATGKKKMVKDMSHKELREARKRWIKQSKSIETVEKLQKI